MDRPLAPPFRRYNLQLAVLTQFQVQPALHRRAVHNLVIDRLALVADAITLQTVPRKKSKRKFSREPRASRR